MTEEISDEDYIALQTQLAAFAGIVRQMPLEAFIARIERTETTAPLFNPTLYRKGMLKLELVKKLAQAALAMKSRLPTLEECLAAERHQAACERLESL